MTVNEIAAELVSVLKEKNLHIAFAESCTGGMAAAELTSVPGASEVFELGVVSYSERIKNKVIDVKKTTLERYSVYSAETAQEMALGVLKLSDADIAAAVTGLAGPGGGTAKKPVGTVYIAVTDNNRTFLKEYHFQGDREEIRKQTVTEIFKCILNFCQ